MSTWSSVDVMGVRLAVLRKAGLLAQAITWCQDGERRTISYANAHCLNVAWENPRYRDVLNRSDLVYSDGVGVVWAARWLAGIGLEKITARDWVEDLCVQASARGLTLYLLGSRPGVAPQAVKALSRLYPGLRILAARDGFFEGMAEADVLDEIARLHPQIVLVGMGVPRQDLWLAENRERIAAPLCWSVGALFDLVAGIEQPVPAWMNALALEWFWRFLFDPLGKWRRYLLGTPLFLLRVAKKKLIR
ncbi:MAG: WecB/TagA/CpsF family glycosyltransferase [Chloroflexota bacterium]